jgi:hypothetical protein
MKRELIRSIFHDFISDPIIRQIEKDLLLIRIRFQDWTIRSWLLLKKRKEIK